MANNLADACRSLMRAKEAAHKRLEELEGERREIKASLKSLDAAIKVLDRTSAAQKPSRLPVKSDKTNGEDTKHAK